MSHYYKLSPEKSKEVIGILDSIDEYGRVVVSWLDQNFDMDGVDEVYPFNEVPMFTDIVIQKNPELKELINKTNPHLNKNRAKVLISDWKNFKKEKGFKANEAYDFGTYAMTLRSMFPRGSVDPLVDKKSGTILIKSSEPSNSKNLSEIGLAEYNLKEIELKEAD